MKSAFFLRISKHNCITPLASQSQGLVIKGNSTKLGLKIPDRRFWRWRRRWWWWWKVLARCGSSARSGNKIFFSCCNHSERYEHVFGALFCSTHFTLWPISELIFFTPEKRKKEAFSHRPTERFRKAEGNADLDSQFSYSYFIHDIFSRFFGSLQFGLPNPPTLSLRRALSFHSDPCCMCTQKYAESAAKRRVILLGLNSTLCLKLIVKSFESTELYPLPGSKIGPLFSRLQERSSSDFLFELSVFISGRH